MFLARQYTDSTVETTKANLSPPLLLHHQFNHSIRMQIDQRPLPSMFQDRCRLMQHGFEYVAKFS